MQSNVLNSNNVQLAVELRAVQAELMQQIAELSDLANDDPTLIGELEPLRHAVAEVRSALSDMTGPSLRSINPIDAASALAAARSISATAAPAITAAQSAVVQSHIEVHERIAILNHTERGSRQLYDRFRTQRSTPSRPDLQVEIQKAQKVYEHALKTGDPLTIARAGLQLDEARLHDMAYAAGRGDRAAHQMLPEMLDRIETRRKQLEEEERRAGVAPSQSETDRAAKQEKLRQLMEDGARDAGRTLTDEDKSLLDKHSPSAPASPTRPAPASGLRAALDGVKLSKDIQPASSDGVPTAPAATVVAKAESNRSLA